MALLDVLGPLAVPTVICLAVGLLLLFIEMFTPGLGVSGILGILSLGAVVVMQMLFGSPAVAAYICAGVLLIIVVALLFFIRSMQKGRLSRSFIVLNDRIDGNSTPLAEDAKNDLIGSRGVTVTPLRPSGIAEFDGKRRDVMTSGAFLEAGTGIIITDVQGLHILVEPYGKQEL